MQAKRTKKVKISGNVSSFDPNRLTVGAQYLAIQKQGADSVLNGDLTHELTKSLVDDLNDTITSNPFNDRPFYILVHETKDLQMKRAIKRRILKQLYRPYPEDDTLVYYVDPKACITKFCWCLPHSTEMDNILKNRHLYHPDYIQDILAWKLNFLEWFGFSMNLFKPYDNLKNRDQIVGRGITPKNSSASDCVKSSDTNNCPSSSSEPSSNNLQNNISSDLSQSQSSTPHNALSLSCS